MKPSTRLFRSILAAMLLGSIPLSSLRAEEPPSAPRPLKIVATIFPAWDWTREVLGADAPDADLVLLQDGGVDLHSYRPTAADLKAIAECDLFIHVGGESDSWVAPALAAAPKPGRRVLCLLGILGDDAKPEECPEGMEHGHRHVAGEETPDEHVWLSLRNASRFVDAIADSLAGLDPARAASCHANAAAYRARLAALDGDYAAAVAAAPRRTLILADRFPLRYLADDYGLTCFAAFSGCSAESGASFKTVRFLASKADEVGARAILVLEGGDRRIARTVCGASPAADRKIVVFDSLQSVTKARAAAGETYLGAMHRNLAALSEALQ